MHTQPTHAVRSCEGGLFHRASSHQRGVGALSGYPFDPSGYLTSPVSRLRTSRTSPKAPRPIIASASKSALVSRLRPSRMLDRHCSFRQRRRHPRSVGQCGGEARAMVRQWQWKTPVVRLTSGVSSRVNEG